MAPNSRTVVRCPQVRCPRVRLTDCGPLAESCLPARPGLDTAKPELKQTRRRKEACSAPVGPVYAVSLARAGAVRISLWLQTAHRHHNAWHLAKVREMPFKRIIDFFLKKNL